MTAAGNWSCLGEAGRKAIDTHAHGQSAVVRFVEVI
jgi:hypothetical protein